MTAFFRATLFAALLASSATAGDPVPPSVFPASAVEPANDFVDLTPAQLPGRHVTDVVDHSADTQPGGWFASGEYLLWRPRLSDAGYALVDPGNDLTPQGRVRNVNFDTGSGLRTTLGYRFASGWDISVAYMYLHADGGSLAAAPNGGLLYPLLTRPGVVDKALVAGAATCLTVNTFDLDFGKTIALDPKLALRTFGGVRFTAIDTDIGARYDGLQATNAFAGTWARFDGAGPTAGAEVRWTLGQHLTLFGGGRGGLLYGTITSDAYETNADDTLLVTDLRDRFTGVVPMMSAHLGGSWQWKWLSLAAGYEVTHWFNVASRPMAIDDFAEGKLVRRRSDLSFDGVFFRLGIGF